MRVREKTQEKKEKESAEPKPVWMYSASCRNSQRHQQPKSKPASTAIQPEISKINKTSNELLKLEIQKTCLSSMVVTLLYRKRKWCRTNSRTAENFCQTRCIASERERTLTTKMTVREKSKKKREKESAEQKPVWMYHKKSARALNKQNYNDGERVSKKKRERKCWTKTSLNVWRVKENARENRKKTDNKAR